MKKVYLILFLILLFSSCNPMIHVHGTNMRTHNLSQNRYQPYKKKQKPIRVGSRPNAPLWWFHRIR